MSGSSPESGHSRGGEDGTGECLTRRGWLRLGAGGALVGLAGCSSDLDSGDEEGDSDVDSSETDADGGGDETGDADGDGANEAAEEHYDDAIAALVANANRFDELKADDVDVESEDVTTIGNRLDDAETALGLAEETATDDFQSKIDAASAVVEFQRVLNEYYSHGVEFNRRFEAAIDRWALGAFDGAIQDFEAAQRSTEHARDTIEVLRARKDDIDHDSIDQPELDYSDEIWAYIAADGWTDFESVLGLIDGLLQYVKSLEALIDGEEAYFDDDFVAARDRFQTSLSEAEQSRETFRTLEDDPNTSDEVRPTATQFRFELEQTVEAIEHLIAAAEAAIEGNFEEADDRFEQGIEALPG